MQTNLADRDTLVAEPKDSVVGGNIPMCISKADGVSSLVSHIAQIPSLDPFNGADGMVHLIFELCQLFRGSSDTTVIMDNRF